MKSNLIVKMGLVDKLLCNIILNNLRLATNMIAVMNLVCLILSSSNMATHTSPMIIINLSSFDLFLCSLTNAPTNDQNDNQVASIVGLIICSVLLVGHVAALGHLGEDAEDLVIHL